MTLPAIVKVPSLEEKTGAYWRVSSAARGRGIAMTTGAAITTIHKLLCTLNPTRGLYTLTAMLQNELVQHGRVSDPKKSSAGTISKFQRK